MDVDTNALNRICELLIEKYPNKGQGEKASENLRQWLSGGLFQAHEETIARHLEERYIDLLFDSFFQTLPFGTGGRRGRVGYGPNRVNPTIVAMTVQGHCNYLREHFGQSGELTVVVANDVRLFRDMAGAYRFLGNGHPLLGVSSRSLGKLACEIYAANGIVAYFSSPESETIPPPVLSTPMLSFAIHQLGAAGGINLSASHNPPDDNGIKVYDRFGSQPIAPEDQRLADAMAEATDVKAMAFHEALAKGMIRGLPEELNERYLNAYLEKFGNVWTFTEDDSAIVYTPLCGCGLTSVGEVLKRLGARFLTPPRQGPDGSFKEIPLRTPNPEVPQSTIPARVYADENGCDIVLSSDPDADRVGLEAKLANGEWYHFDGNQIATVLCNFLMLDEDGPKRRGLVIETLVTTRVLSKIVEFAEDSWIIDDLLVGFKYMGNVLRELDQRGRFGHVKCSPDQLVFAAEESHGTAILPTIRDKDSSSACMYLAALYQIQRQKGRTLLDYYCDIIERLGSYDDVVRSIMMTGAEGNLRKERIMKSLRAQPFETLCGEPVLETVDYWDQERFGSFKSETDQLPRNVVCFKTRAFNLVVRPSGTEPKLKFYCQQLPQGECPSTKGRALLAELRERTESFARQAYREILGRIDISLGEVGLLLPDIFDLNRKMTFEKETIPQLRKVLNSHRYRTKEEVLEWLREASADMIPGADPLPAIKPVLAHLFSKWSQQSEVSPLLTELREWAQGQF